MRPTEKSTKSKTSLAVKNSEQKRNSDEIHQPKNTFGHAGKSRANPEAGEPYPAMLTVLVTTDRAKHPAGDKSAEDRLRHDDSRSEERRVGKECRYRWGRYQWREQRQT